MSIKYDFEGKHVWVTGAGRGIGYSIAKEFSEAGATVTGFDVKFENTQYGFKTVELDVTKGDQVRKVTEKLLKDSSLDVLVNAAGVLRMGSTDELDPADWQLCFDVNVTGPFNLFQSTMPVFKNQRKGSIVTVASNSAHVPRIGMSAYGASKAATRSLCETVGLELAPFGVRCNIVSPGSTDTEMLRGMLKSPEGKARTIAGIPDQFKLGIPLQKIATPEEISAAVLFLASDAASHVILQDIVVDGGATLGA